MPLPMIPRPRNPKLNVDGWMSLSARTLDDDVMSKVGDIGRSAVGLSKNEPTDVFLLVEVWLDTGPGESAGLMSMAAFFSAAALLLDFFATVGVSSLAPEDFRGLFGVFVEPGVFLFDECNNGDDDDDNNNNSNNGDDDGRRPRLNRRNEIFARTTS